MRLYVGLLGIFFFLALTKNSWGQNQPKLVVGIVVDQMRNEYIQRYWNKFSDDGFKKLIQNGYRFHNCHYNYVPTYTAPGHSSIFTGTTPSVHGIIGNWWYKRELGEEQYCAVDKTVHSIGVKNDNGQRSPIALQSNTIGDELRLSTQLKGKVFGVAIKDRSSIYPAGRLANGAFWFEPQEGKWISSTYYYDETPGWLQAYNKTNRADYYLTQTWNTVLPIDQYTESWADNNPYEIVLRGKETPTFPYKLSELSHSKGKYNLVTHTPFGIEMTWEVAKLTLENEELGQDNITDMLTLSFSSPDKIGHLFGPHSVEVEDTYLRLDKKMAEIITYLNENIGENNYVLFLTADHGAAPVSSLSKEHGSTANYIDHDSIKTVLIDAITKNFPTLRDSVIVSASNYQLFFTESFKNRSYNAIYTRVLDLIEKELLAFSGISKACQTKDLPKLAAADPIWQKALNGYYPERSGDYQFVFKPGWMDYPEQGTTHGSPYSYDTHVPLLFYGKGIKPGESYKKVKITDIAYTLSLHLGIPLPDGSFGDYIME